MSPTAAPERWLRLLLIALLALGCYLRLEAAADFKPAGTDEYLYAAYVKFLHQHGLASYPDLVEIYIRDQAQRAGAVLPPMRVFYIIAGTIVNNLTGWEEKASLNAVSAFCTILLLPLAAGFAWRLAGPRVALVTLALFVFAPTQLFMARHAMIDVTVALWSIAALWTLWEALQVPEDPRRLVLLGASLAGLVLTKENSFFTIVALGVLLALNPWLKFGKITRGVLAASVCGLAVGGATLIILCGGIDQLFEGYRLLVASAYKLEYAIQTGDGPWHRYLYEETLVNPLIMILALGMILRLRKEDRAPLYLAVFVIVTYAVMASVKFGMNLRYTNLWDMPLRFLAASLLVSLVDRFRLPARIPAQASLVALTALLCFSEFHLYERIFVEHGVYEPITPELLHAVDMLKL